uniref:Fibronectin type-III domain-containing protein n=1 Tax=Heliothis virescens TaxID=7102 RepID=A0A2A4J9L7_HELVI
MKSVFILFSVLLASFSHGDPVDEEKSVSGLKAPERAGLQDIGHGDDVAFAATWSKVVSDDPEDPVIGYSAYLWEIKKVKTLVFVDGEQQEDEPPIDNDHLPDGVPMITTVPANKTIAFFYKLKMRVAYEIRVKAYTKSREGPFSSAMRLKVLKRVTTVS